MQKRAALFVAVVALNCVPVYGQTHTGPAIHAFGFGDVNFVTTQRDDANGFVIGQLVGHVSAGLTDRLAFFGEASTTARAAGYTFEIERAILRYEFADAFKLSAGRYHTPISYWNTAFHHGLWLQTSVARPQVVRFGSRFVPVHFVGLLAEGLLPTGPLGLGYIAGVGNGRQADNIVRAGNAGDTNTNRAWTAGLRLNPPGLPGFQVGAAIYGDKIELTDAAVDERIMSAHVALTRESPELLAEYFRVQHDLDTGEQVRNDGWYVQLGYRLPGVARAFKPYARLERVDVPADDPLLLQSENRYAGVVAGVRMEFAEYAAFKAEYRRDRVGTGERVNSLWLQASFAVSGGAGESTIQSIDRPTLGAARQGRR